jgi:hypothetical protein
MSSEDKIWTAGNQPATLIDGDNLVPCTLGEAVIARDHLAADRMSAAKIKYGARVYTASEIDRLYQKAAVQYSATLANIDSPGDTYCNEVIFASTEDEAMAEAERWGWAECGKRGYDKAWVLVKGGTINGTRTARIDLTS